MPIHRNISTDDTPPPGDLEESALLNTEAVIGHNIQKLQRKGELNKAEEIKNSLRNSQE